jgi:hypothetical protein
LGSRRPAASPRIPRRGKSAAIDSVDVTGRADRPYDIVLFGATGFTRRLTADYLARHAPPGADGRWRSRPSQAGGDTSSTPCPAASRCRAAAPPQRHHAPNRGARYPATRAARKATICTAVAPGAVRTVRTYGTRPLYGPRLVHTSDQRLGPKTPGQCPRRRAKTPDVSQVRLYGPASMPATFLARCPLCQAVVRHPPLSNY